MCEALRPTTTISDIHNVNTRQRHDDQFRKDLLRARESASRGDFRLWSYRVRALAPAAVTRGHFPNGLHARVRDETGVAVPGTFSKFYARA